jgi:hypothetical protein
MKSVGNVNALITLSPIVPERLGELRNRLRFVRYFPGLGRPLLQLGFIHYARWSIVDGLPQADGKGGWQGLRSKYLLFLSNFDGETTDYLDAFTDVLPARIAKVWGSCVGFEAKVERVRGARGRIIAPYAFRNFVRDNRLTLLDSYEAYPESATAVRQAIGMQQRLAAAEDDQKGANPILTRMQQVAPMALGPVPGSSRPRERFHSASRPWIDAVFGRYGVNPLTIVTPLPIDGADDHVRAIRSSKPLSQLEDSDITHFARLALIKHDVMDIGQPYPDRLKAQYLLYMADAWGSAYDHIEELRKLPTLSDTVWGGCVGYPGCADDKAEEFHAWLISHALRTNYYVSGYPARKPGEIGECLAQRQRVKRGYELETLPSDSQLLHRWDGDRA